MVHAVPQLWSPQPRVAGGPHRRPRRNRPLPSEWQAPKTGSLRGGYFASSAAFTASPSFAPRRLVATTLPSLPTSTVNGIELTS